jgi:nucleotide-binding universal stress UspA family protein
VPTKATEDPPAVTLQPTVVREQARLIVAAARHGGDGALAPSGSVAARLTRLSPCPVIAIPEGVTATLDRSGAAAARRAA